MPRINLQRQTLRKPVKHHERIHSAAGLHDKKTQKKGAAKKKTVPQREKATDELI